MAASLAKGQPHLPPMNRILFACALAASAVAALGQPALSIKPPTAADTASFQKYGRPLPDPEILQPMLDRDLPPFTPRENRDMTAHLTGAASDVLANLAGRWIAAFEAYYPHVTISVPPPYSGRVGAKELVGASIDFALVSRELVPQDVTDFQAKYGYAPLSVPIMGGTYRDFGFLDAIGVFVNEQNPITKLSFTQLDGLLSKTRHRGGQPVRKWGDVGLTGEWADRDIHVWGVKPWNGFEEFVRERVLSTAGQRGEWRSDLNFTETVFPIAPHVAADRDALGYAGLAYLAPGVKLIALQATPDGPYLEPSYENVARATYPLSRVVYCNLNREPGKAIAPALAEFLRFVLSKEGQQVVLNQAVFIPLRETQATNSRKLIDN